MLSGPALISPQVVIWIIKQTKGRLAAAALASGRVPRQGYPESLGESWQLGEEMGGGLSGSSAASLCLVFNELLATRGADAQTKAGRPCLAKARLGAPSHPTDDSQAPLMDTEPPLGAGCRGKRPQGRRKMSPGAGNTLISEWKCSPRGSGRCLNWELIWWGMEWSTGCDCILPVGHQFFHSSALMLRWDLLSVPGQLKFHGAPSSPTFLHCYCLAKAKALFRSKTDLKILDGFSCYLELVGMLR